ncbi:MAG: glutamyl-tRNA reductase [Candidatus Didemnitutus sp.]|nr:glutamyl-tRNA reductase [Candidatus Didemnitutus sp.]
MDHATPVLVLLGASHHTAPLAVREKLAFDSQRTAQLVDRLRATTGVREFALLNTCNRIELYSVAHNSAAIDAVRQTLSEVTGCAPAELSSVLVQRENHDAIGHLFDVASGLDSQIVGEVEILGQVKDAYDRALAAKWTGPVLNRVFQKTFQAAKHIRTHTGIGAGQISIATVAVDLAGKIFGELDPVKILVVGAGEIGLKTAQAFQSRGARSITVASRTLSRAEETAAATGGWAATMAELPELLAASDVVASSTSSPNLVVTRELAAAAMKHRAGRPLFLIDLALPRDIDPACTAVPNVYLYNLDDLAQIAESNLAQRQAEVAKCRAILAERTAHLWPQVAHSLGSVAPQKPSG